MVAPWLKKVADWREKYPLHHAVQGDQFIEPQHVLLALVNQLIEMSRIEAGEVDVVHLVFSQFKSVVTQIPTVTQLIPVEPQSGAPSIDLKGASYEYEPDESSILETLLPRNLTVQILSALLDNMAGFYASQMTAMDNATRNAGDMIKRYTLEYNRSRQAQITKELIEIISGAEAV